jgi:alpha-1,3-rhamnosyl/mannosyltransferase
MYDVPEDLALSQGTLIKILRLLERLLIRFDSNSVLFAPNYFLPENFRFCRGTRVSTIHDLGFRKVPWTLREHTLRELGDKFEPAVFGATRLISVSAAVRDELNAYGYASPNRVDVIHHGPGQLANYSRSEPSADDSNYFVLHVGTIEPRKNVEALLGAWSYLRQHLDPCPTLVLGGRYGWKSEDLEIRIQRGTEDGWIRHLGYVTSQELAELYASAAAVVFPSHYEGFGLPAIEALWAGAPLVCSDLPALREVAGEAALYFEPDRPDKLADRLHAVLSDPALRADLISKGRARLKEFSWDIAAEKTLDVWFRAAGTVPPHHRKR